MCCRRPQIEPTRRHCDGRHEKTWASANTRMQVRAVRLIEISADADQVDHLSVGSNRRHHRPCDVREAPRHQRRLHEAGRSQMLTPRGLGMQILAGKIVQCGSLAQSIEASATGLRHFRSASCRGPSPRRVPEAAPNAADAGAAFPQAARADSQTDLHLSRTPRPCRRYAAPLSSHHCCPVKRRTNSIG